MAKYAIGLDYGTLSVRALMVDIHTGEEVATSVYEYPHGVMETRIPSGKKLPSGWALQDPQDYMDGLITTVRNVMKQSNILPEEVIGIGLDFTSSTILPVKADKTPLCFLPEFKDEPHAYVKLWKHHGGEEEALQIDQIAKERGEKWISLYGGKVSSEWMMPKILETIHHAPEVYKEADRIMEAMDWIIWELTGEESRSACGAGYKAFYHHEMGYPSKDFFKALDPMMENIVEEKLDAPIKGIGETAGYLTDSMARVLGLLPGTPVGTAIIDAHSSLVGSGISKPGTMMIIVGTSSCHMILSEAEEGIPGVAGIVKDGIMPGYFGYEAGQCCVGDHFAWFTDNCVPVSYEAEAKEKGISIHQLLTEKLSGYKAGQSGLIALDWFNGVRSPLMDFNLNGLIMGMNLLTKPEEIYLSLIEATAYGTRMIVESFEEAGVPVDSIVLSGGIPLKNKMLIQVYTDICNREIKICGSSNASAMGAAILGIAAASEQTTGYKTANEAAEKLGRINDEVYTPNPENAAVYDKLYAEYKTLHEYFGKGANDVMKRLNAIRDMQK
ncbi:MAG: ribulokinase [Lachnospiraceae bacterium]|nr:ribulokinase [Lachnospiraceae bacterium]